MSWKAIETSREIRQWAKILIPVALAALYLFVENDRAKRGERNEKH